MEDKEFYAKLVQATFDDRNDSLISYELRDEVMERAIASGAWKQVNDQVTSVADGLSDELRRYIEG